MKKRLIVLQLIIMLLLGIISATSDIAYILKNPKKPNQQFLDVFKDMNLKYDLIADKDITRTDFLKYRLIFIGPDRLSNSRKIPISTLPSVIVNPYYGKTFGLMTKDRSSKITSNAPLKVKTDERIIKVYQDQKNPTRKIGVPYYYLNSRYKLPIMQEIAGTYRGDGSLGDVISYSTQGENKCFFGITESKYWTTKAKSFFKDCINFALTKNPQPICGDNLKDTNEICDGTDLNRQTCISQGFLSGNLACSSDCLSFDTFNCIPQPVCGNNIKEAEEICDRDDLNGETCITKGFFGGTLACKSNCLSFSTYNCIPMPVCGDGVCEIERDENIQNCPADCNIPQPRHDVSISIDLINSINGIRIKDLETNKYLTQTVSKLICNREYEIDFKTANLGNFAENVDIIGIFRGYFWNSKKDNLLPGESVITSKTLNISFEKNLFPGFYYINVTASISSNDTNPDDNTKSRFVQVICGI
ncbi:MAG: hypothetical protein AABX30_03150 [Nanoarchaeota archaeon]